MDTIIHCKFLGGMIILIIGIPLFEKSIFLKANSFFKKAKSNNKCLLPQMFISTKYNGELSNFIPNRLQFLPDLIFKLMGFLKHLRQLGGQPLHFHLKRLAVVLLLLNPYVSAKSEYVILFDYFICIYWAQKPLLFSVSSMFILFVNIYTTSPKIFLVVFRGYHDFRQ